MFGRRLAIDYDSNPEITIPDPDMDAWRPAPQSE
jgi:hypothetical protein